MAVAMPAIARMKGSVETACVIIPTTPWKSEPKTGIVEGAVTGKGVPIDHAHVMLEGHPGTKTVSDGSGWYGILNVTPGKYRLRVSKPGMTDVTAPVVVTRAGQIATLDVEMRAEE